MALDSYANLQTAVLAWAERTGDTTASDKLADCVVLCEAQINQVPDLRLREAETVGSNITLSSGSGSLPTNFLAMLDVTANLSEPIELEYTPPGKYMRDTKYLGTGTDDTYGFYTIIGSTIRSVSSATLAPIYYAKVPALATTDPNWLLTKAPNVYLFGTLMQLEIALEGSNVDKWSGLFAGALAGLIGSETFNRGAALRRRATGSTP